MSGQDVIMMLALGVLNVALIPALRAHEKPPRLTSSLYAGAMLVTAIIMLSLQLWLSAAMVKIGALGWGVLLVQNIRNRRQQ